MPQFYHLKTENINIKEKISFRGLDKTIIKSYKYIIEIIKI
jgi:hypothetical protein